MEKDTDVPTVARDHLASLLSQACGQFDWRLDHDKPVLLNRAEPITEAINSTRGRALGSLINFGFWVRRQFPEDQLPEITDILAQRIPADIPIPLTRPEHALLGMHFANICTLNREWAAQQRKNLFPQKDKIIWRDAFGSYIRLHRPFKPMFEVLGAEFNYALANLSILTTEDLDDEKTVDRLAQHLFSYYIWGVYPLTGDESLIECFYGKTTDDRQRWARLFDHVGRSLRNSGKDLDEALIERVTAFFSWRFGIGEPSELQEFTFWLDAECLDPDWRLQSYSQILDLGRDKDVGVSLQVKALNKLLPNHVALVVEYFAKVTDSMDQSTQMYMLTNEATPILKSWPSF